ncbi:MAG: aldolase [Methylocystis sp.]|nr:aldolase [Methylocystis sp.]
MHANALVIGETGLLIRGPSRAGKSALTLALIAGARARRRFARLVGDDRVSVQAIDGRVIARPHPRIAGLIEKRGVGVIETPYAPECVLRLVIDLCAGEAEGRNGADATAEIACVRLPRIVENAFSNACVDRILAHIQNFAIN